MKTITEIWELNQEFIELSKLYLNDKDELGNNAAQSLVNVMLKDAGESPEAIRGLVVALAHETTLQKTVFEGTGAIDQYNSPPSLLVRIHTMMYVLLFASGEVQTIMKREANGLRY